MITRALERIGRIRGVAVVAMLVLVLAPAAVSQAARPASAPAGLKF